MNKRTLISLLTLAVVVLGQAAIIIIPGDPPARLSSTSVLFTKDTFESYADGAILNGLNGGNGFLGAYVDNGPGIMASDDAESYADGAALDALNGGNGFTSAYVDRVNFTGVKAHDDSESYTDAASLNGLNGGTGWSGAFVDR